MILSVTWLGIDVSKQRLDLFDPRQHLTIGLANTEEAVSAAAVRWAEEGVGVAFEATGSYDRVLRDALQAQGVPWRRLDPARVRAFASAVGRRAKTDPIDARVIAAMAASLAPEDQTPGDPTRDRLTALVRRRDQLVALRAQEKTRLSEATPVDPLECFREVIAMLSTRIERLHDEIRALVAATPALAERAARLTQVPGVGPVTATVLLALLPELGQRDPKRLAALVGLAPFNRDSGRWHGLRHIAGGRARVRRALYMAALTATRQTGHLASFYLRLINAGKPKKVAIIAVARKLLTILNAMLRDNLPFRHQTS